jgi:1-acyl-sn-glycerol-3-phosphate acyltransferase
VEADSAASDRSPSGAPDVPGRTERAHRYARERGVSRALYAIVRAPASLVLRAWFRVRITGAEHVPGQGPAIVAANHKSFLDAFFLGLATRRHVRYMAKAELFRGPLRWLFTRLGAFPVQRGEHDREALITARTVLEQGGLLIMFPEGTRIDEPDALGSPHHGAGRLAVDTGAPIVPAAILGTSHLWLGPVPKPRRVDVAFLPSVAVGSTVDPTELIDRIVWPAVRDEYGRLAATPGLIAVSLAALGLGSLVASRRRTASRPRLLGVIEPRRLRRRSARRRRFERLLRR